MAKKRLSRVPAADSAGVLDLINPGREVKPAASPPQVLPISALAPCLYQPRRATGDAADSELADLANSIRALGMIEPIAVRPSSRESDRYEILAGHRRWAAARLAGLTEVPVIVHPVDDLTAAAMALVENLQRQDLNALDEAVAMRRMLDDFKLSQAKLGRLLGLHKSVVSRTLGLLVLPETVQELVRAGRLEAWHAQVLLGLDAQAQIDLARQAAEQGWSVRELERRKAALSEARPARKPSKTPDPDIRRLETRMGEWFSAPVRVKLGKKGGTIEIRFSSIEECDGILQRMGFKLEPD